MVSFSYLRNVDQEVLATTALALCEESAEGDLLAIEEQLDGVTMSVLTVSANEPEETLWELLKVQRELDPRLVEG